MTTATTSVEAPSLDTTEAHADRAPVLLRALGRWFGPLATARTWKETLALLLTLPAGIVWFTMATTALSVSASLLITIIGIPLLLVAVRLGRLVGSVERTTARALLDMQLAPFPPVARDGGVWARVRRSLSDRPSWRGIAYALGLLPVGIVMFTLTFVLWCAAAAAATFPLYGVFMSDSEDVPEALASFTHGWGRAGATAAIGLLGLVLLGLTPRLVHGLANLQRRMVGRLLSSPAADGR